VSARFVRRPTANQCLNRSWSIGKNSEDRRPGRLPYPVRLVEI